MPDLLRLSNGVVELGIPTGHGPRVAHYGFAGEDNVFGDGAGGAARNRARAVARLRAGLHPPALRSRARPAQQAGRGVRARLVRVPQRRAGLRGARGLRRQRRDPDLGSSVEVYTEGGFCEVETLGPLATVPPGGSLSHVARWSFARVAAGDTGPLAEVLEKHLAP